VSDPLLIGLDAGTTNLKAMAMTPEGRVVAEASAPTTAVTTRPAWAHYEPQGLWRAAASALRRVTAALDDPSRIRGLAVGSMAETAVPVDDRGAPTHEAIAWFDRRAEAELAALVERVGLDRLFAISGLTAQPIFGICKMMWLKANAPEAYARTRRWLNVADYIAFRLSGEAATDYSLGARTFALDIRKLAWSEEVIDAAGVDRHLFQKLVSSGTALGRVTPDAAAETGLPATCLVAAGGMDHPVGAFGVDSLKPGVMLDSIGTTEAFLLRLDAPCTDPAIGRAGYSMGVLGTDRPNYFVVGGIFTAGAAVEWFRHAFAGGADYDTLLKEAAAAPPGSLGVGFLPHLRLAPPPNPYPHPRGAFWGLSTDADRGVLFRALLEGLCYAAEQCAEGIRAVPTAPEVARTIAIGGGTRDDLRMGIKATLAGAPITIAEISEGVCLGAAKLAGLASGVYKGPAEAAAAMPIATRSVDPDPARTGLYARLYAETFKPALERLHPLHEAAWRITRDPG